MDSGDRREAHMRGPTLESILAKAEAGDPVSEDEIVRLLSVAHKAEREPLFAAARRVRARHTGDRVFLYGFIYLSRHLI